MASASRLPGVRQSRGDGDGDGVDALLDAAVAVAAPCSTTRPRCRRQRSSSSSSSFSMASLLLLLAPALLLSTAPPMLRLADAAPLPLHLRWLHALVPPSAAGPVLREFFWRLPDELCGLGLEGMESLPNNVMDELCPLKAATRIGRVVPGAGKLLAEEDALIAKAAAVPVTIGGGLMLMAAANATESAALQRRLCDVMIDPLKHCGGRGNRTAAAATGSSSSSSSSGSSTGHGSSGGYGDDEEEEEEAPLGPLAYHLDAKDSLTEFLASKMLPLALSPVGSALGTLPDVLCSLPTADVESMPRKIRSQLCPYDVAIVPVVALVAMGRTGSSSLEAKLCDVLKRPREACARGKYRLSPAMQERLKQIQRDTQAAVYSWEPKVPRLPQLTLPKVNLTGSTRKEQLEALAAWWEGDTAPELRRYALSAFLPPALQQPASMLLERLPDSVCGALQQERIKDLPVAFKASVCPFNAAVRQFADSGSSGGISDSTTTTTTNNNSLNKGTWATALAEVAMGVGRNGSAASRAKVEAWVMRMCSAVYAPDVACQPNGRGGAATASASSEALELVGRRVKPVTVELVTQALNSMPQGQRQKLVDGVGRQLELWSARARVMPRPMAKAMFGPFCNDTTAASSAAPGAAAAAGSGGGPSDDDISALLKSAALDALRPRNVLEAIVGEGRARVATDNVCSALLPPPPPPSPKAVLDKMRTMVTEAASWPLRRFKGGGGSAQ